MEEDERIARMLADEISKSTIKTNTSNNNDIELALKLQMELDEKLAKE